MEIDKLKKELHIQKVENMKLSKKCEELQKSNCDQALLVKDLTKLNMDLQVHTINNFDQLFSKLNYACK